MMSTMKPMIQIVHSMSSVHAKSDKELCFNFGDSCLPEEWRKRITQKLCAISEVFALHYMDLGQTDKVKHSIKLYCETAFKHKARPIHPNDFEAVRQHLEELLESGIICESESSSLITVVRKKNGDIRLCIDYRKLTILNCHLNVVEGFEYSNDPRSYVVWGYMPLVGSPKANRS